MDAVSIEKFREWLERHDPEDVVGYSGDPNQCPFACYMTAQGHKISVGISGSSNLDEGILAHPEWLDHFIFEVDMGGDDQDEIYAKDALNFLEKFRPEPPAELDEHELI